jgi:Tol biopolymer transport system component/streptogramin lyase/major membrane immunogen (membrane-anchored lipoprotein)
MLRRLEVRSAGLAILVAAAMATPAAAAPSPTLTAPADNSSTGDTTPALRGTAGTAAGDSPTVTIRIYQGPAATGTPVQIRSATRDPTSGAYTAIATALGEDTYTARAEQEDAGGNAGYSSANTFTVDHTAPGANGLIAYSGGSGQIFTVHSDGSGIQQLTSGLCVGFPTGCVDGSPSWSPDGTRLVFSRATRSPSGGDVPDIYVINADGTGERNLTSDPAYDDVPVWSPDGTRIAFASNRSGSFDIYTMNVDQAGVASDLRRITTDPARDDAPCWSPDGTKIAFASDRATPFGNYQIYTVDVSQPNPSDPADVTQITHEDNGTNAPSWSPDGSRIGFGSIGGLFTVDATTGGDRSSLGPGLLPKWSPDGTKIVTGYLESGTGQYDIYVMNSNGTGRVNITNTPNPHDETSPDWQPTPAQPPDKTAPSVTLTAPADGASFRDATPALKGAGGTAAGDSATVTIKVYAGFVTSGSPVQTLGATRDSTTGAYSVDADALPDGTYTALAEQTDSAGNTGFSSAHTFTVDTIPPAVTLGPTPIMEYPIPTGQSQPLGITAGPDGALWFVEQNRYKVGRVTTDGVISEFPIPTADSTPRDIAAGSDGALWFTEEGLNKIGRVSTSGVVSEFVVPTALGSPFGIAPGPDGALWFTEGHGNRIGRITTSGTFTEYPIPNATPGALEIVAGPDGALWFAENTANMIGRVTTNGTFTEFAIPTNNSGPEAIAAGPDGAIWFTETTGNNIGRITPTGVVTEFAVPTGGGYPIGIAAGPDGALWFTEFYGNKVGRITTGGAFSEFDVSTANAGPIGITAGPDGALWFTELYGNRIGRIGAEAAAPIRDASPALQGIGGTAAGDAATVTINIYAGSDTSGTPIQTRTATRDPTTGAYSVDANTLPDGTYTARAEQSDDAGNTGFSSARTFTVDTTAPRVTLTAPANGASLRNATPALKGTASTAAGDSATVMIRIYNMSGTLVETRTATRDATTGAFSRAATALPEGTYTARAEQTDDAGNTGFSSVNAFTIDTTAPTVTLTEPAGASSTPDPTPALKGSGGTAAGDAATVRVRIYQGWGTGGTLLQTRTASRDAATGAYVVNANVLPDGPYTARAQQVDAAGNTGLSSTNLFTVARALVVADPNAFGGTGGVIRVASQSGARTTVSRNTSPAGGPAFADPSGVAVEAGGSILVADPNAFGGTGGVIRVNAQTGARTTLSSNTSPAGGPAFADPSGVAVEAGGSILVADPNAFGGTGGVIRVNAQTGARTTLSSNASAAGGPAFVDPSGVAVEAGGSVLVADPNAFGGTGGVIRIDARTGARNTLSSNGSPAGGPAFVDPSGVTLRPNGNILVADPNAFGGTGGTIRVNAQTGARALLSRNTNPAGAPSFADPFALAVEVDGNLAVADSAFGGIIRVNPAGIRSTLSSNASPAGAPSFVAPRGIAVEQYP